MRRLIAPALVILVFSACFSQEKPLSGGISAYSGIILGSLEKYLYEDNDSQAPVSLLEWEQRPLVIFGAALQGEHKALGLRLSLDYALPLGSGSMYDSDWNTITGVQTTYSISQETAVLNLGAQLELYYKLPASGSLIIMPSVQAHYAFDSFTARNGYGWYGGSEHSSSGKEVSWDDPDAHYYPDGKHTLAGADYCRHEVNAFAGISLCILPSQRVKINAGFFAAPVTLTASLDHHLSKSGGKYYQEIQLGSFKRFRLELGAEYTLSSTVRLHTLMRGTLGTVSRGILSYGLSEDNMERALEETGSSIRSLRLTAGITLTAK